MNHNPNISEIHAEKIKIQLKDKAKTTKNTPAQLFSEIEINLPVPEDTLEKLPNIGFIVIA